MATATKICRVCGKEYPACHTLKQSTGVFRWQDVACSPECGAIYLSRIEESRNPAPIKAAVAVDENKVENTAEEPISLFHDDEEEDFEEDFESDEE